MPNRSKEPAHQKAGSFALNPDNGIITVDTHHVRPNLDASHFIVDNGRVAIVDTGTALGLPYLLTALQDLEIELSAVDYVLLTHIHLDHAGGVGLLLSKLPNAKLIVHPRGARHMIDPAKLVAATIEVYGESFFKSTYGPVVPVAAERVISSDDGYLLTVGNRKISVWYTPGHALHHQVFVDHQANVVIAGDAFGVSYREFDVNGRAFIMPATTPSHFNPEQMIASIERITAWQPKAIYVTHYSRISEVPRLADELKSAISRWAEITKSVYAAGGKYVDLKSAISADVMHSLNQHNDIRSTADRLDLLSMDIELDTQGLWHWVSNLAGS